jgi:Sulfotransferase family
MGRQGTPAELGTPVVGGEQVPRSEGVAPVTFVGGTGRSGTHVLAQLLSRNEWLALVPVEVRFHTDPDGFPGLLAGEVPLERFMKRLRGYWWKGFQTRRFRGMYRFVERDRFDAAAERFERSFADEREAACRALFLDLLSFRAAESEGAIGIVEQSTDTVAAAPTLTRVFPDARFIHVVRDGRDASASRVGQTRGLTYPRTRRQGLEWWEERIRAIDAGAREIPRDRLLTVSLDELLLLGRHRGLRPICRFARIYPQRKMKRFFLRQMSPELAHSERWRAGLSDRRADGLQRAYEEIVDRLEADGVACAPLLRRTLERSQGSASGDEETTAFLAGDGSPLRVPT